MTWFVFLLTKSRRAVVPHSGKKVNQSVKPPLKYSCAGL